MFVCKVITEEEIAKNSAALSSEERKKRMKRYPDVCKQCEYKMQSLHLQEEKKHRLYRRSRKSIKQG